MAGTKFSDYLGLNHYKKAKKLKHFIHLRLANWPQSLYQVANLKWMKYFILFAFL